MQVKASTPMQNWTHTQNLKLHSSKSKEDLGEKGVEKSRYKHSDTFKENPTNSLGNRHLKSLPKHAVFNWNLRSIFAILVNIQSLYPKLDTIMHDMQIENSDMAFITETWIDKNWTCN